MCLCARLIPPSSTDLHDELTGVRSSHGGALTSCEDPHGPDVESCRAEEAAQHHSLQHRQQQTLSSVWVPLCVSQNTRWEFAGEKGGTSVK